MSDILLSTLASILLAALSFLILVKESSQGRVPLAIGLLFLGLMELFEGHAMHGVEHFMNYKRLVLICMSLIPANFLLYGMLFARRNTAGSTVLFAAPSWRRRSGGRNRRAWRHSENQAVAVVPSQ